MFCLGRLARSDLLFCLFDQFAFDLMYRNNLCLLTCVRMAWKTTVRIIFKVPHWLNLINNRVLARGGKKLCVGKLNSNVHSVFPMKTAHFAKIGTG